MLKARPGCEAVGRGGKGDTTAGGGALSSGEYGGGYAGMLALEPGAEADHPLNHGSHGNQCIYFGGKVVGVKQRRDAKEMGHYCYC